MKAKELRISNYVENDIGDFILIDRDTLPFIVTKWIKCHHSIPLTEEWLVKFGFVKDKKHDNCCDLELENDFYLQGVGYGKRNIKYEVILTDSNDNELTLVKHVHQLQNLYFALTGEELTIK